MKVLITAGALAGILAVTGVRAEAQLFYIGVRAGAGIPTGSFADTVGTGSSNALLTGARPGLGYGLDAGLSLGPMLGAYASYDRIAFGCSGNCASSGKYTLKGYAAGVRVGIPLLPLLKPWAKAGITLNELEGELGGSNEGVRVIAKRSPGYEIGAGVDIPVLAGFFTLTPQVRRVRQKLESAAPDIGDAASGKKPADYYTFDLGLRLRSPI